MRRFVFLVFMLFILNPSIFYLYTEVDFVEDLTIDINRGTSSITIVGLPTDTTPRLPVWYPSVLNTPIIGLSVNNGMDSWVIKNIQFGLDTILPTKDYDLLTIFDSVQSLF